MKDLRIFEQCGFDLKDIILVDNATHCFGFQVDNGIPMVPFFNSKEDKEMVHLFHYLKTLVDVDDVRPELAKKFNLTQLREPSILEKIEGIIEIEVEDVDDDFFNIEEIKGPEPRPTLPEPSHEDIPMEGLVEVDMSSILRTIPKTRPSNCFPASKLKHKSELKITTRIEKFSEELECEIIETEVYEEVDIDY
jgi:hypothetical protein